MSCSMDRVNKDIKDLLSAATRQGFEITYTGSGHWRCTAPDGRMTVVGSTPRGGKSLLRVKSKLRKLGVEL